MKTFVILLAVLCSACTPESAEKRAAGAGADARNRPASTPSTAQAGSSPAPSSSTDSAADAAAELRRLVAARQMIAIDHYDIDPGEFEAGGANPPSAYAGEYHFGDSEGESTLTLSVRGNAVTGILGYADWENEDWVPKEVRLDSGRIERGKLTAPGWSGIFVSHQGQPGLIIIRSPAEFLQVEFGERGSDGVVSP
jgi:hypothetical protein